MNTYEEILRKIKKMNSNDLKILADSLQCSDRKMTTKESILYFTGCGNVKKVEIFVEILEREFQIEKEKYIEKVVDK